MDLLDSPDFSARLAKHLDEWHVPGMTIALVHNGKVASQGFGYADVEKTRPATPDMLFNIASCSKAFTAGLLGITIADEKYPDVQWDSVVSSLLPGEFALADERYTDSVTIDDIICHRTGLAAHDRTLFGPLSSHPDTPKSITNNMKNLRIETSLRTKHIYNNLLYSVAAYINEKFTGLTFPKGLQEKIFGPLGMTSSFVHVSSIPPQLHDRIAVGHNWVGDENRYKVVQAIDQPEGDGAGCIITSVQDHVKWINTLLSQDGPITPEIYKELVRARIIDHWDYKAHPFTSHDLYAAGWIVRHYRGYELIMHGGCDVGFGSCQFFLPDQKFGGAIHGNSEEATALSLVAALMIVDEFLGVPQAERPDWSAINKALETKSPDDADSKQDAKPDEPQTQPLDSYVGMYWNVAYKEMTVEIKDGGLYINAEDRGYPYELVLEHISAQTKYRAKLRSLDTDIRETLDAEFELVDGKATRMGLYLDDHMYWFDRIEKLPEVDLPVRSGGK